MIALSNPGPDALVDFIESKRDAPLSYREVGCSAAPVVPAGFWRDEARVLLGHGEAVFDAACELVMHGEHFPPAITRLFALRRPVQPGDVVAIVYRLPPTPVHFALSTRVLETFDEAEGQTRRRGFTYGTLAGHIERGEERFAVEWNRATDDVYFTITAVSRPAWWLVWLGLPIARAEQARFRRLACQRMTRLASQDSAKDQVDPLSSLATTSASGRR